jgi:2-polyprenyl-3-methyl-5-hydroxy-6-metoxy-1,4-benzoquinol methylase
MTETWERRYSRALLLGQGLDPPAKVLASNVHLLPASGLALDLACGNSGNGLLLAQQGLDAHVWDTAPSALALQEKTAAEHKLCLTACLRDCEKSPPETQSFDVISVCHFLHRASCARLVAALKPGGLLFYQTFHCNKVDPHGPSNPDFLLRPNELLMLFKELELRYYREDGACGKLEDGDRNRSYYVGQKPPA